MSQFFNRSTNTIARFSIFGTLFLVVLLFWMVGTIDRSAWVTQVGVAETQPVPFSHAHHVGGIGIDCRYCHTTVEEAAFANVPPTKTCMNCHSQLFADSQTLEPVRASFRTDESIRWTRVHDLPDYVYFDHSIHVAKGVGCSTCHGAVERMPLIARHASLQMEWCLECHREPERFLRRRADVFRTGYEPPADQLTLGRALVEEYGVRPAEVLTSCSTCHR